MPHVELSFGRFRLVEPSLAGWDEVLRAVPPEEYPVLQELILAVWQAPPGAFAGEESSHEEVRRIVGPAMPLARRFPRLAAAFVAACLREGGEPVEAERVYRAPGAAGDLMLLAAALLEHDVFGRLGEILKNRLGPVLAERRRRRGSGAMQSAASTCVSSPASDGCPTTRGGCGSRT